MAFPCRCTEEQVQRTSPISRQRRARSSRETAGTPGGATGGATGGVAGTVPVGFSPNQSSPSALSSHAGKGMNRLLGQSSRYILPKVRLHFLVNRVDELRNRFPRLGRPVRQLLILPGGDAEFVLAKADHREAADLGQQILGTLEMPGPEQLLELR